MFDITKKTCDYISVVATHACNKHCPFCIDSYRGQQEYLTLQSVEKAADFSDKNGIKDILIVGGEPTLHPEIVKIASIFKDHGLHVILTTNYTNIDVVKALDGIVDCFNISYLSQKDLPKQKDYKSDLTLSVLIHKKQLNTSQSLDSFIDKYKNNLHLKFSTLSVCNDWTKENQDVPYLDYLDCEYIILFNEILGQVYKNTIIKRYDRLINKKAKQSLKVHVDGTISDTWNR